VSDPRGAARDREVAADGDPDDAPAVRRLADWDAAALRDLASEYGTPLYALDVDRARENLARLRAAFERPDRHLSVRYAVKANAAPPLLSALAAADAGAECASAAEVERALAAGVPAERVRYTAVNPPARDLDAVCDRHDDGAALAVTVGARDTLDRLAEREFDGRLFVRVAPGIGAGHHEKVTVGDDPTFGVPPERAVDILSAAAEREMVPEGVHAHLGSGVSDDPEDLAAYRELVARLAAVAAASPVDLETVAVGGGFGVPYHPDEPPIDLGAVAAAVHDELAGVDAALSVEPGRAVVADAGVLLTRVNTVRERETAVVAGVDAGMTTLVRPALYDARHPVRSLAADAADRETVGVTVTGPVCESADVLCRNRPLARPERGDVLAAGMAGAYGYAMASPYNGRPRPATVALTSGDARLARRRETVADLRRLETDRASPGDRAGGARREGSR
jgi:diaminopimelate decarboxylase